MFSFFCSLWWGKWEWVCFWLNVWHQLVSMEILIKWNVFRCLFIIKSIQMGHSFHSMPRDMEMETLQWQIHFSFEYKQCAFDLVLFDFFFISVRLSFNVAEDCMHCDNSKHAWIKELTKWNSTSVGHYYHFLWDTNAIRVFYQILIFITLTVDSRQSLARNARCRKTNLFTFWGGRLPVDMARLVPLSQWKLRL